MFSIDPAGPRYDEYLTIPKRARVNKGIEQIIKGTSLTPIRSGSMILPRVPHFRRVESRYPDISA